MFKVEAHLWKTADGRLVSTGHPDAAVLAYAAGTELPDAEAQRVGLMPGPQGKSRSKPADKSVSKPADKGGLQINRKEES